MIDQKYARQHKYNTANSQLVAIRLNNKTDIDILSAIEGKKKQTEIKRLIRLGLDHEKGEEK